MGIYSSFSMMRLYIDIDGSVEFDPFIGLFLAWHFCVCTRTDNIAGHIAMKFY